MEGAYVDPHYRSRREGAFIVAVNCGEAGSTCFCVSMETGPKAKAGYDLSLTEIAIDGGYEYLVEFGSDDGRAMLATLPQRAATDADFAAAEAAVSHAVATQGRSMDTERHPRPAARQPRSSALGRRRRALPDLRQLHHGLPDLLLHQRGGFQRPCRRDRRAQPALGFLLHDGLLLHPRRLRARPRPSRAIASG